MISRFIHVAAKWYYFILFYGWVVFQRRQWHPTPVLLGGTSHGRRSLVGCSPWGRSESDTIERLHFHFSLSCIGEGNGNPLQCSCLENLRDRGAWWVAIYGVAQSWTRLKWLSSSSSSSRVSAVPPQVPLLRNSHRYSPESKCMNIPNIIVSNPKPRN